MPNLVPSQTTEKSSRRMTIEESVKEFHFKYGHLINYDRQISVPSEVKELRINLIKEEFKELMEGLDNNDTVEIADGACDLIYVIVGTMISYGLPTDRLFREVHRSNMTKTPVKAKRGKKYGTKTPKGPDYIAPDIKGILANPNKKTELEILND
jgi:predicted HAD superfamily Cof-like phosphohydrolase